MTRIETRVRKLSAVAPLFLLATFGHPSLAADGDGPEGGARLEVEELEVSIGTLPPSEAVEGTFVFRNVGAGALEVRPFRPPRRVLLTEVPEEIPPGGEARLRVEVDLRGESGRVRVPVSIGSNDPDKPRLELALVGTVEEHVAALPGYGRWSTVQGEEEGTIPQTLRAADGEPFEVTRVEVPHPGFRAEARREAEEEAAWFVDLTLDRWAPVGSTRGWVAIHTTHPLQPVVWVRVSAFVRPILAATPPELVGEAVIEEPTEQRLLVQSFATGPVRVIGVDHDLPGVPPGRVETIEEGRRYAVVLSLGPELPAGPLRGELRIRSDHPDAPMLRVPVDAEISRSVSSPEAETTEKLDTTENEAT